MEYSRKPVFFKRTQETLRAIKIEAPDEEIRKKVLMNWDNAAKPLDGMGRFEALTARIGAVLRNDEIDISKKAVLIMCADNGIVEEGQGSSCVFYAAAMLCRNVRSTIMGSRSPFAQDVRENWRVSLWESGLSVFGGIQSSELPY